LTGASGCGGLDPDHREGTDAVGHAPRVITDVEEGLGTGALITLTGMVATTDLLEEEGVVIVEDLGHVNDNEQ